MKRQPTALRSGTDQRLIRRVTLLCMAYYDLTCQSLIDVEKVLLNRVKLVAALNAVKKTGRPETLLFAEHAFLNVEKMKLHEVITEQQAAGRALSPELKRDITSLDDGIRDMNLAANVFLARQLYGEDAYHDISVLSRSTKEIDASGAPVDVLRKNTKSHETRLGNMASGTSQTEIGRRNQSVIGLRRQNMADCRSLYVTRQREFLKNRTQNS